MHDKRYLVVDIQNFFKGVTGKDKILTEAERVKLTKFIINDALSKIKGDHIVRNIDKFTLSYNFEEPFMVKENTLVYVHEYRVKGTATQDVADYFEASMFGGWRAGPQHCFHSKYFHFCQSQDPYLEKERYRKVSPMLIPKMLGRMILHSKHPSAGDSDTVMQAILMAFNLRFEHSEHKHNAAFAHYH